MSNNINNPQKSLAECQPQFLNTIENLDHAPPFCGRDEEPNKRGVNSSDLNWFNEDNAKEGLGARADCDPMKQGLIRNDPADPNPTTLYRYSKGLRGCDEAILDMFSNIEVLDEEGKAHRIPIIWASQEKAVAAIMQDNVRKDESLVVDRIRLPMLAVNSTDFQYDVDRYTYHGALDWNREKDGRPGFYVKEKKHERDTVFGRARGIPVNITYTLYAWTMYIEDMNQIIEQIMSKFSLDAYIRVRGVAWEIPVQLDSIANNLEVEPGDQAVRVVKFQFNLTAKTYIPQPITRRKAVLKTRVELVDGLTEEEVTQVMARIEEAVKELEC